MKITILTISFAMIAGLAFAADDAKPEKGKGKGGDPAARAEAMMKKLDTDKDGKVSKEEFAASPMAKKISEKGGAEGVDKMFGRMDGDKDGSLSKEEIAKGGGKPKGEGKPKGDKKPKSE